MTDEEIYEDELNPCSPVNCKYYFYNSCILMCPVFECSNCKKYPCDKFTKSTTLTLTDFIPELREKEINTLKDKIQKCLHKRIWLMKNKGYELFNIPESEDIGL